MQHVETLEDLETENSQALASGKKGVLFLYGPWCSLVTILVPETHVLFLVNVDEADEDLVDQFLSDLPSVCILGDNHEAITQKTVQTQEDVDAVFSNGKSECYGGPKAEQKKDSCCGPQGCTEDDGQNDCCGPKKGCTKKKGVVESQVLLEEHPEELFEKKERVVTAPEINMTGAGETNVEVKKSLEVRTVLHCEGICCPAEIPVLEKMLMPLEGVESVKVNVVTRTCAVVHLSDLVSPGLLCKMLNQNLGKTRVQKTTADLDEDDHTLMEGVAPGKQFPDWNVSLAFFCFILGLLQYVAPEDCRHEFIPPCGWAWLKISSIIAVLLTIFPVLRKAWVALTVGHMDTNFLMAVAVCGASALNDFNEAAAVVVLFSLADWLQARATESARNALEAIISLRPDVAVLADSGATVPVEDVTVGTELIVKSGDKVPLDGDIIAGETSINESNLTGESEPVQKQKGDSVSAGTVNVGAGYIVIKTTALSSDSAVARLVRLVEDASEQRSATEQLVEQIAKVYTPVVVLTSLCFATIPWAVDQDQGMYYLRFSLVLLVIACPCALVISTPVTYVSGLTEAARDGVLVKGGKHLETLGNISTIALDKTGTLTMGRFDITEHMIFNNIDEKQFFSLLYTIELLSSHPMAIAIVAFAKENRALYLGDCDSFRVVKGEGVTANLNNQEINIGNMRMMQKLSSKMPWDVTDKARTIAESWEKEGCTVSWVVVGDELVGLFAARDAPRAEAKEAVTMLKELGLHTVMLTGDNKGSALVVQEQTGVEEVHAKLLPEEKVARIIDLRQVDPADIGLCSSRVKHIAMVGDGVNDAPALAGASVGIAIGAMGTVAAMETADVVLMDTDLRKLSKSIKLGQACVTKIYQNIFISLITKVVVLALAFAGYVFLWLAILTDVGTMILVTLNSVALLTTRQTVETCENKDRNAIAVEESLKSSKNMNKQNRAYKDSVQIANTDLEGIEI